MATTGNDFKAAQHYLIIAGIIVLACIALFSLDKNMHSPTDFFKPVNLMAFIIYFIPTTITTFLMFRYFTRKHNRKKSTTLALITGIPLGFAGVIITILLLRP